MRKLSELEISPTPWTVPPIDNDFVHDSNGESVCQVNMIAEDAPFIAAAPDMYEALLDAVGTCHDCTKDCSDCLSHRASWMPKARAALAKAAGEKP